MSDSLRTKLNPAGRGNVIAANEGDPGKGYRSEPLSVSRRWVAASSAINREQNTIHLVTEADISEPRRLMAQHRDRTGERLSLTAYVVFCLARTLSEFPRCNAFRRGRRLFVLGDVTVNVLFEREIDGEMVPDPVGIRAADRKSYREIHDALRAAQGRRVGHVGATAGVGWIRWIPIPLFKAFVRLASRSVRMQQRFGVVAVTAIGMFGKGAMWPVPLTHATVTLAVGSIVKRCVLAGGAAEEREHLCLTVSFNHDLIDGAPAARFTARLVNALSSGEGLREATRKPDLSAVPRPSDGDAANDGS